MQKFSLSYVKAINKRLKRTGSLFQGAFQAVLVDRNDYFLHLSRYIHLNPVIAGLVHKPEDWIYSSYQEYIGIRDSTLPQPDIIYSQIQTSEISEISEVYREYQLFVEDYSSRDMESINHLKITKDTASYRHPKSRKLRMSRSYA